MYGTERDELETKGGAGFSPGNFSSEVAALPFVSRGLRVVL